MFLKKAMFFLRSRGYNAPMDNYNDLNATYAHDRAISHINLIREYCKPLPSFDPRSLNYRLDEFGGKV